MQVGLRMIRMAVVGVLLTPYGLALAQGLSTVDLMKGNYGRYATSLAVSELPDGFSAVRLTLTKGVNGLSDALLPAMVFARLGNAGGDIRKFALTQCYWSNGDTVKSMNREFLVTYRLETENFSSATAIDMPINPGVASTTTPTVPRFKIYLVALDSIGSISPAPDVTKAELIAAFTEDPNNSSAPTAPTPMAQLVSPASGSVQQKLQNATLSNIRQAALGTMLYAGDYDDVLPFAQGTKTVWYVTYPYLKSHAFTKTLNPRGGQIQFNIGLGGSELSRIPAPAKTVLLFESEAWADGRRAVAFCDGHGSMVSSSDWNEIRKHLTPKGLKRHGPPLPLSYDKEYDKILSRGSGN